MTGCWLLVAEPMICLTLVAVFIAAVLGAKWQFNATSAVILLLAYTSTGLTLAFGPSFPAASVWLTALAGLVVGGLPWRAWPSPAHWRWPLMLWLLGIALSWPIIALREADFSFDTPRAGVGFVVVANIASLSTGLWLESALAWDRGKLERLVGRPLLVGVLVSAAAVFYQAFVDRTWLTSEPWISMNRPTGLMSDANPMAVAAALWAPLVFLLLHPAVRPVLGPVLAAMLWYSAWLTSARTSLLLFGAGAVGLAGGMIARRPVRDRTLAILLIVGAIGTLIFVAGSRLTVAGPIARLAASFSFDQPRNVAWQVLWWRDGYGPSAVLAFREQPWSGVGNGSFNLLASHYRRLLNGPQVPADNAQNLWRHALAERGVLGFPAVVALTVLAIQLLWRHGANIPPLYSWLLKAMLIGLGLALTVGVPTQNPALAITAAFLLAWLHSTVGRADSSVSKLRSPAVVGVWLLALAGAGVDIVNARTDLRPAWRAARLGDAYFHGFGAVEVGPRGASGRVVTDHAVVALRPTGPQFVLRCWVRGSDARPLRVWQDKRLVIDELLPAGVLIERSLDTSSEHGMVLEFETADPGVAVAGEFSQP